jgi:anti-sigma factor RsiW
MRPSLRCREVAALLGAYVEGRLPEARSREIDAHAAGCPRCEAAIAVERRVVAAVASEPPIHAPGSLAVKVMAAVYRASLGGEAPPVDPVIISRAYRRIGLSFVLSAALVATALVVPGGLLPGLARPAALAAALEKGGGSVVRSALVGADALVRGALRPTDGSRGGTPR